MDVITGQSRRTPHRASDTSLAQCEPEYRHTTRTIVIIININSRKRQHHHTAPSRHASAARNNHATRLHQARTKTSHNNNIITAPTTARTGHCAFENTY